MGEFDNQNFFALYENERKNNRCLLQQRLFENL